MACRGDWTPAAWPYVAPQARRRLRTVGMVSFDVPFARIDARGLACLTLVLLPLPVMASKKVIARPRRLPSRPHQSRSGFPLQTPESPAAGTTGGAQAWPQSASRWGTG